MLVLLLHHAHKLSLRYESKSAPQQTKSWCIKQTKESLGPHICDHILFIHAFFGCDVTSNPFGLGKGLAVKEIKKVKFREQAEVINCTEAAKDEVVVTWEKALLSMYGGGNEE